MFFFVTLIQKYKLKCKCLKYERGAATRIKMCYAIFKLGEEIKKNKSLNNSKKDSEVLKKKHPSSKLVT